MIGILTLAAVVCLVTSVLDMMMNGGRDAEWAPFGLGIAALCGLGVWGLS